MEIKTVEIYSTPTCGFCHMLKKYLDDKGVKYVDYDLSEDTFRAKEMVELSGQSGVPVTIVNKGETDQVVIVGFNKPRVDEALGLS